MRASSVKSVLVITRPRTRRFYEYVASKVFDNAKISYLSEYRGAPSVEFDIIETFYNNLKYKTVDEQIFTLMDVKDIIIRDRFLRTLEQHYAMNIVYAMASTIQGALNRLKPDVIFSIMPDNYIMDIFERLQTRRKKIYIGTVMSLLNGYFRITRRGELLKCRNVSEKEALSVLNMLTSQDYSPEILNGSWVTRTFPQTIKAYLKEKLKSFVFPILRFCKRDPLNFHYNCINGIGATSDKFSKLFFAKYYDSDWKSSVMGKNEKAVVLLPLQFSPESSIDYKCENTKFIEHNRVILDILKSIPSELIVLVKEHPSMPGKRDLSFYQQIRQFNNVKLISPFENMRLVLEYCGHIITWSGSTGLEGRLMGKHVICLTKPYYFVEGEFDLLDAVEDLPELLKSEVIKNHSTNIKLIRNLLEGCLLGELKFIDFDANNPKLAAPVDVLISSLKSSFEKIC